MPILVENIGDSLVMRARHTDGNDNFSEEHVQSSAITTTEIPYMTLYGHLGDNSADASFRPSFEPYIPNNSIVTLTNEGSGRSKATIIYMQPKNVVEMLCGVANHRGTTNTIHRIYRTSEGVFVEQIDLSNELNIVSRRVIDIIGDLPTADANYAMIAKHDVDPKYLLLSDNDLYSLDIAARTIELLDSTGGVGFAWSVNEETKIYYILIGAWAYIVNPETGEIGDGVQLTFNAENIGDVLCSTTNSEGTTYAKIIAGDSSLNLCTVNLTTGVCTLVHVLEHNDIKSISFLTTDQEIFIGWSEYSPSTLESGALYNILLDEVLSYEQIHRFTLDNDENYRIAYNIDDGHLYRLIQRQKNGVPRMVDEEASSYTDEFVFEKINPYSLTVEQIELSGYFATTTDDFIDDGGDDMFDDSNYLSTNLSAIIPYTQQTRTPDNSEEMLAVEDYPMDGEIVAGDDHFGVDSLYFTNTYPGLFVLAAYGISIDWFWVDGNLGADGNGEFDSGNFTVGGYKVFWTSVSDANDPSVNHLFIVPDDEDVAFEDQEGGENEDEDHGLLNMANVDRMFYLLFAKSEGAKPSIEEFTNIATEFIAKVTASANIAVLLAALNTGYADVTDEITEKYNFSDYADLEYSDGLRNDSDPKALTYDPVTEAFYAIVDDVFVKISTDGRITELDADEPIYYDSSGIAIVRQRLFAITTFDQYLSNVSKTDGELLNPSIMKTDNYVLVEGHDVTGMRGLTSFGPHLITTGVIGGPVAIITIDPYIIAGASEETPANATAGMIIDSYYYSLAAEHIPVERALFAISSDDNETVRKSTIYNIDPSSGEALCLTAKLSSNWVSEDRVTMTYHAGYFWRLIRVAEEGQEDITQLQKIHPVTRHIEYVIDIASQLKNMEVRAMIWMKSRAAFVAANSAGDCVFFDQKGQYISELTATWSTTLVGFFCNSVDQLFMVGDDASIYALDNDLAIVPEYFGEEEDGATLTVADWTVTDLLSATTYGDGQLMVAYLTGHASLPNQYCILDIDLDLHTGAIINNFSMPPLRCLAYDDERGILIGSMSANTFAFTTYDDSFFCAGMLYRLYLSEENQIYEWKETHTSEYKYYNTLTWNYDDNRLYYFGYSEDDRLQDQDFLYFAKINPHTEEQNRIQLDVGIFSIGEPKSLLYVGQNEDMGNYLLNDHNGNLFLVYEDGIVWSQFDESPGVLSSMAMIDDTIYGCVDGTSDIVTVHSGTGAATAEGTVTLEYEGFTLSAVISIALHEGVCYIICLDSTGETDVYAIATLNIDTLVGEYLGNLPNMSCLVSGLSPVVRPKLEDTWYYDVFNIGKMAIYVGNSEEVPDLTNLEVEVYSHSSANEIHPPDLGWKRVKVESVTELEGSQYLILDHPMTGGVDARMRYRNPNSDWTHIVED